MGTQKIEPEEVDMKLFTTFSELGYDGASMEALSQATGLKKASLYHRFPDGKKEMALQALSLVEQWIRQHIVAVATDTTIKPETRLKKVMTAIDQLYNGGTSNCLLRTLSVGTDAEVFKEQVSNCFHLLEDGFAAIAIDLGATPQTARQKAKHVNLLIQGSLILAGATGETTYFKNGLAQIPAILIKRLP